MTSLNPQLVQRVLGDALESSGFSHYGVAKLSRPLSIDFYREWLDAGKNGTMEYLRSHLPQKEDATMLLPKAQTAIVVAAPYIEDGAPFKGMKIARYALGASDYHIWLKEKLEVVIVKLKDLLPNESFLAATDSAPILERDLAYRAGLGWFGKNTCMIDQHRGSFFLLGEILTTAEFAVAEVAHPDRCGTCRRCIDACPTKAIDEHKGLDARLCISYLTIESKDNPPEPLREAIGDHFFGCDICQTVCPWNRRVIAPPSRTDETLRSDLKFILTASKKQLERAVFGSPLARARGRGLKRNAIVVVANLKLREFVPELQKYVDEATRDPQLAEIAKWAIDSLTSDGFGSDFGSPHD